MPAFLQGNGYYKGFEGSKVIFSCSKCGQKVLHEIRVFYRLKLKNINGQ